MYHWCKDTINMQSNHSVILTKASNITLWTNSHIHRTIEHIRNNAAISKYCEFYIVEHFPWTLWSLLVSWWKFVNIQFFCFWELLDPLVDLKDVSFFLSKLVCHIRNLANKHSITPTPAYIWTHINVEGNYILWRRLVLEWHLLPYVVQAAFQLDVDLLASSHTKHCHHYWILKTLIPQEALRFNSFNYPANFRYVMLSSSCFSSGSSVHVSNRTCDRSGQMLNSRSTLFDGVSLASNMMAYDLIRDFLVDWVLRGLPLLHFTFGCSGMCCAKTFLFLWLLGSGMGNLIIYNQSSPAMLERTGGMVCLKGCSKHFHFCP